MKFGINKCKYLRIRKKNYKCYGYCTKHKKEVPIFCKCDDIEYKILSNNHQIKNTVKALHNTADKQKKIKQKSNKLAKKERYRFSILYADLTKCAECGCISNIEKNEVFEGAYRQTSIKLGMVVPFCQKHHKLFHNDIIFNLTYKVMFQKEFIKTHTLEEFISIFKQDYIYKLEKLLSKKANHND